MATRISLGGNWKTAGSWAVVDATSLLDSEAGNTALTTSYVSSQNFAPGAIEVDGIAVKIASRATTPSGTITINLRNVTDSLDVKTVVLNVSDLPTSTATNKEGGWIFFKFDEPVTLLDGKNYCMQARTSSASQVNLFRNGTAGNWSRMLRTTTTGAPAAGDQLDVLGEHTGQGTGNDITITMDNDDATDYGSGTAGSTCITVCKRGTLAFDNQAATNYLLRCSGNLIVYNEGIFTMGTVANPIPRDSTAIIEFDPGADGAFGFIRRNGTVIIQGLSRTLGKNVYKCLLNTDEAAGQTELGVDTDTGWLAGDEIAIASTSRVYSQCEKRTIAAGGADIDHIDITAGLTYAHEGTDPAQAEIILLTRNVRIRSTSSSIMTFFSSLGTADNVDIDWVEFYYMGENATGKRAVDISSSDFDANYCCVHDCEDYGVYVAGAYSASFTNSGVYNTATVTGNALYDVTSSGTISFENNVVILTGSSSASGIFCNRNTVVDGCRVAGARYHGIDFEGQYGTFTSMDNVVSHSNGGSGILAFQSLGNDISISNIKIWRNATYGFQFYNGGKFWRLENFTIFGNSDNNMRFINSMTLIAPTFENFNVYSEASYPTNYGMNFLSCDVFFARMINCDIGGNGAHDIADINIFTYMVQMLLVNTLLGSPVEVIGNENMIESPPNLISWVKSAKHNQIAGTHKSWFKYGVIETDPTYFKIAAPSQRLTPNDASNKLESGSKKAAVNNGNTVSISVWVRKSTVAEGGADYNGNQPRLVLKRNDAAGITADVVLDTMIVAIGDWEQLIGTTPAVTDDAVLEFVIDCDGTAGFVNVDDWAV